jgi:hypothetical protein
VTSGPARRRKLIQAQGLDRRTSDKGGADGSGDRGRFGEGGGRQAGDRRPRAQSPRRRPRHRGGVRAAAIEKVELAVGRHGYRRDPVAATLARRRECRLAFVIPTGFNSFLASPADGAPFDAGQERIPIDADLRDKAP